MMQNRFKSWALWLAIASLVGFVTKTYFNYEIPEFDKLVDSILIILTTFGILNNPTDPVRF